MSQNVPSVSPAKRSNRAIIIIAVAVIILAAVNAYLLVRPLFYREHCVGIVSGSVETVTCTSSYGGVCTTIITTSDNSDTQETTCTT